ncbi:MAG: thioesterase [Bacteroidales bacterium]|nr:thioesterase [Bacteroidales bacterium]
MENYFEKQFELRYFEMNNFGEASTTTILTLLEEAAADHCHSIDHSLYELEKQNIGWVLVSGIMEMDRYPSYKEKITIRTWLSEYSMIRGLRENIIYDEKMNIIGRAKGLWVFFDIERRRPTQIFESIINGWSYCSVESIKHDITKKIKPIDVATNLKEFKVHNFDVDANRHVSNIKYLQWLMESMPEEIIDNYFLYSIDGRFISEAQYGDTVVSLTEKDINNNCFIHTIKTKENNKVCSTAKTLWKKRYK